ncbi:MAG: SAM-dependent methyltransferase [Bacillota bacterium]
MSDRSFTALELGRIQYRDGYPRSSRYDPLWVIQNHLGSQCLWLTESLTQVMDFRAGMRVLDIGCGNALSSIFLAREFGVEVWAVEPNVSPSENAERAHEAGVGELVFPIRADARDMPFPRHFFDAAISINAYWIFGTDDFYLPRHFAPVLKPGAWIGLINPGLKREYEGEIPSGVKEYWIEHVVAYHSPEWWKRHLERSGLVDVRIADTMGGDEGHQAWRDWAAVISPGKDTLIEGKEGSNITFTRVIAEKKAEAAG